MSTDAVAFELYKTYETMMSTSRLLTATCLGVCVWDWLTTFHLEVRYIWKRKLTPMDIAFFCIRYGVMIQLAVVEYLLYWPRSTEACSKIYRFEFIYPPFMYMIGGYVLAMRVYAIWGKNRQVLAGLIALVIAQAAVQFWNPQSAHQVQLPEGVHACIAGGVKHYWLFYICPLIFDLVVLVLTLYKSIKSWKNGARSTLMAVIARDALVLFILAFVANCANIINYALTPTTSNQILLCPFACALQGIAVCRIVLNIHTSAAAGGTKSLSLPSNIVHGISLSTFKNKPSPSTTLSTITQLSQASAHSASKSDHHHGEKHHQHIDVFDEKDPVDSSSSIDCRVRANGDKGVVA